MRFSLRENMQGVRAHFLLRIANWVSTAPYTFIHTFIVSQICKKVQGAHYVPLSVEQSVKHRPSTGQAQVERTGRAGGQVEHESSTGRAQVEHRSSTGRTVQEKLTSWPKATRRGYSALSS